MDENKKKKYRYKAAKDVDNEAELDKLMTIQPFMFEEESEVSELRDVHDNGVPGVEIDR
jgi:hypothetical protein